MAKKSDIPEFGMLSGVKVAFQAVSVAGPFFGTMCADHGADVVWIEPAAFDPIDRSGEPLFLEQDRRNMRSLKVDVRSEEGREVFLKLLADVDIFLEGSKGGTYERWGLTDEVLWEANPKLVIIHLSGFGLWGDEGYVTRASYDPIAQAFGGMMYANYMEGEAPRAASALIADFYSGLFAFGSGLAGYIKALRTGQGESIEISQFESVLRCMCDKAIGAWNYDDDHPMKFKPGNFNSRTAGYNSYLCGDGNYVYLLVFGASVMEKACKIMGVEWGSDDFPVAPIYRDFSPEGKRWDAALGKFCMDHTAKEVEAIFSEAGIPAMCMMKFEDMLEHPHFKARESIIKVHGNLFDRDLYVSNIFPKVKNAPGKIWRQAPHGGEDTVDILTDLGYSAEEIDGLIEDGAVAKYTPAAE